MAEHACVTIDCDYVHPRFAAAYLRVAEDEAAFVETNTALAAPKILAALDARGMKPEAVRWVIVTHVHLDHAGGAGALVRACPNATLLAHPRAVRHLIDPSKLVGSATHVYGEARFRELYGEVEPVPAERVRAVDDGETVQLGDATLRFLHVRGHANHHMIVHDPARDAVFTGDAFGLVYPALQRPGPFAFPSTSPTDFDPGEARAAIRRIVELGARSAYLTHFGEVTSIDAVAAQLVAWLDVSEVLLDEAVSGERRGEALVRALEAELRDRFEGFARDAGFTPTAEDLALVGLDLELNAQGIAWTAARRRDATRPSVV